MCASDSKRVCPDLSAAVAPSQQQALARASAIGMQASSQAHKHHVGTVESGASRRRAAQCTAHTYARGVPDITLVSGRPATPTSLTGKLKQVRAEPRNLIRCHCKRSMPPPASKSNCQSQLTKLPLHKLFNDLQSACTRSDAPRLHKNGRLTITSTRLQAWTVFFPQETSRAARDSAKRRLHAVLAADRATLAGDSYTVQEIKREVGEVHSPPAPPTPSPCRAVCRCQRAVARMISCADAV